ncbi:MAG: Alkaline phosphatase [Flaviaesturariibacter sp.]|nr:Alkaline phosphatase [Flaviaesturariibacter sp.]
MRTLAGSILFLLLFQVCRSQVLAGPMLGPVELRDARIWLEVAPSVRNVQLSFSPKNGGKPTVVGYQGALGKAYNPLTFTLANLEPATTYAYSFIIDGKRVPQGGTFTTKELWQWRRPAPDFSFLTGSCSYVNEPVYDRPGKPYGGDSSIFSAMAREKAAFTMWLGDNWYYREVDYFSPSGLWYRAHRDRSQAILQPLLKAMPHYAIWDDHDYGPNDADKSYILKEESRNVFRNYWPNPSFGENGQGIYTLVSYGDVDIFLMDDRWFRSSNDLPAEVDGKPNAAKRMWGSQELEWLKNALATSRATFKLIATGNQTLNLMSSAECLQNYPIEFNELQDFLRRQKVDGVIFLTGDRHHSEVIRYDRPGTYPLYDVTNSPFTSGVSKVTGTKEEANSARIAGTLVEAQNYSRVTVSGPAKARRLGVEFRGIHGELLGQWSISETELKTP